MIDDIELGRIIEERKNDKKTPVNINTFLESAKKEWKEII